jgi:hypothetical protein
MTKVGFYNILSSHITVIQAKTGSQFAARNLLILTKAAVGIEPTNKGFAEIISHPSQKSIEG